MSPEDRDRIEDALDRALAKANRGVHPWGVLWALVMLALSLIIFGDLPE